MNKHKSMIIPDVIFQTNQKLFATINPKNACKLEFSDHLWLPFLHQPQSDVVIFLVITSYIYKNVIIEWKHGIGTNDIITFNEKL